MRRRLVVLLSLGALASCGTAAFASTIGSVTTQSLTFWSGSTSIPPSSCSSTATQDTYIDAQHKNNTHGSDNPLVVIASSKPTYTLVQFTPCAPANAKILSATLQLTLTASPGSVPYGVYPMNAAWSESSSWNTSGADVGTSSITSTTASGGTVSWSLTSQVQAIVDGGGNNGWAIGDDSGSAFQSSSFASREAGSNPPTLVLSYYP